MLYILVVVEDSVEAVKVLALEVQLGVVVTGVVLDKAEIGEVGNDEFFEVDLLFIGIVLRLHSLFSFLFAHKVLI